MQLKKILLSLFEETFLWDSVANRVFILKFKTQWYDPWKFPHLKHMESLIWLVMTQILLEGCVYGTK